MSFLTSCLLRSRFPRLFTSFFLLSFPAIYFLDDIKACACILSICLSFLVREKVTTTYRLE